MYLLDTNIVSELRRPRPHGAVLAWLAPIEAEELFISAITMGEIQTGIERTRARDLAKAEALEAWADEVVLTYQVIPIDAAIIREWARLRRGRRDDNFEDNILGITAMLHRLVLVTRNIKDFGDFDVEIVNPFQFSGA
jgi:predicted nucleic acid-binding protein